METHDFISSKLSFGQIELNDYKNITFVFHDIDTLPVVKNQFNYLGWYISIFIWLGFRWFRRQWWWCVFWIGSVIINIYGHLFFNIFSNSIVLSYLFCIIVLTGAVAVIYIFLVFFNFFKAIFLWKLLFKFFIKKLCQRTRPKRFYINHCKTNNNDRKTNVRSTDLSSGLHLLEDENHWCCYDFIEQWKTSWNVKEYHC